MDVNETWDILLDLKTFTEAELQLVTDLMGYSLHTLEAAIYARTGFRDLEQLLEAEGN